MPGTIGGAATAAVPESPAIRVQAETNLSILASVVMDLRHASCRQQCRPTSGSLPRRIRRTTRLLLGNARFGLLCFCAERKRGAVDQDPAGPVAARPGPRWAAARTFPKSVPRSLHRGQ